MKASDALKLPADEFWQEVSRAVSPPPWPHDFVFLSPRYCCLRCKRRFQIYDIYGKDGKHISGLLPEPCTEPPRLTDPLEVVARQLQDQVDFFDLKRVCERWRPRFARTSQRVVREDYAFSAMECFAMARPEEQVACCLVALGKWEI